MDNLCLLPKNDLLKKICKILPKKIDSAALFRGCAEFRKMLTYWYLPRIQRWETRAEEVVSLCKYLRNSSKTPPYLYR
jgi:hypothetical protein